MKEAAIRFIESRQRGALTLDAMSIGWIDMDSAAETHSPIALVRVCVCALACLQRDQRERSIQSAYTHRGTHNMWIYNSPLNTKYVVIDYKSHSIYWRSINLSCHVRAMENRMSIANHPNARFFIPVQLAHVCVCVGARASTSDTETATMTTRPATATATEKEFN